MICINLKNWGISCKKLWYEGAEAEQAESDNEPSDDGIKTIMILWLIEAA